MHKRKLLIFPFLLVLYEMATYLANDMYLPALPDIMQHLNITHHLAQMTLTVWFFGSASMQLIVGPLSDRWGRRPILLIGGVLFAIATLICAITNNIILFLVARFIQGSTICSVIVTGYATIHELLEHKQAIRTLAWMGGITILAPAFGPLVGALLLKFFNWRMIFWLLFFWGVIPLTGLFFFMPETISKENKQEFHFAKLAIHYGSILKNKSFLINTLCYSMLFAGLIVWIVAGPFLAITQFNKGSMGFSIYQLLIFGSYIIGTRLVSYLIERFSLIYIIRFGVSTVAVSGLLSTLLAILFPTNIMLLIICFMIFSGFSTFAFAPLQRMAVAASDEPMGLKMAVFSTFIGTSGILTSLLVGFFYDGQLISVAGLLGIFGILAFILKGFSWQLLGFK